MTGIGVTSLMVSFPSLADAAGELGMSSSREPQAIKEDANARATGVMCLMCRAPEGTPGTL